MKKFCLTLIFILSIPLIGTAQFQSPAPVVGTSDLTGVACAPNGRIGINTATNTFYFCATTFHVVNGGSTTPPGGADTNIQYNTAGAFGGDAAFIFNTGTKNVTTSGTFIGGALQVGTGASHFTLSGTPTAARTVTFPDANTITIVPSNAGSH